MASELPGRVPELVEGVEHDADDDGNLYGTVTVIMRSGNRYRVHVEPLPGNID
jgi:hypothetical protein